MRKFYDLAAVVRFDLKMSLRLAEPGGLCWGLEAVAQLPTELAATRWVCGLVAGDFGDLRDRSNEKVYDRHRRPRQPFIYPFPGPRPSLASGFSVMPVAGGLARSFGLGKRSRVGNPTSP